jgi:hypothetical protein
VVLEGAGVGLPVGGAAGGKDRETVGLGEGGAVGEGCRDKGPTLTGGAGRGGATEGQPRTVGASVEAAEAVVVGGAAGVAGGSSAVGTGWHLQHRARHSQVLPSWQRPAMRNHKVRSVGPERSGGGGLRSTYTRGSASPSRIPARRH